MDWDFIFFIYIFPILLTWYSIKKLHESLGTKTGIVEVIIALLPIVNVLALIIIIKSLFDEFIMRIIKKVFQIK
ncbi:hypothetical protein [Bacillus chungangensis]|uniref:Uncharacterized protein n=1 Tax=Bacillus chungangensis TaxID=587633 RepID=A0ABT9WN28_9BACI|nr:hypothetical protein [Bacillus chungangensis]MDQ0174601.1 hypothetical protein [Bacillus chungangensis]